MRIQRAALLALLAATPLALTAEARTMIAVLPPDYDRSKTELLNEFGGLVAGIQPGDRLEIYSAPGAKLLASLSVPDDPRAQNPAWRKRQLGEQFRPVLAYLDGLPPIPTHGSPPENLDIPGLVGEFGRNVLSRSDVAGAQLLLIGSMKFWDGRDDRWNMTDRYYPSDGHIRAAAAQSPFGVAETRHRLRGVTVHYCWPGGEGAFATREEKEADARFLSLWTAAQDGRTGTMSFDLATCFKRFAAGDAGGQPSYVLSPDTKLEMKRVPPAIPATLPPSPDVPGPWFLRDDTDLSQIPPASPVGIAWIGSNGPRTPTSICMRGPTPRATGSSSGG